MEKVRNQVHCFIDEKEVPLIECDTEHQKLPRRDSPSKLPVRLKYKGIKVSGILQ